MSEANKPAGPSSASAHLTYPAQSASPTPPAVAGTSSAPAQPSIRKDRLYIGNLHPSVDEYTLLQVFSKHGKISKLDFLFHKTGALKGKPRGYAFIEYSDKDDALKALMALHDRVLRGRKLIVTFAHQAPIDTNSSSGPPIPGRRRHATDTTRPTTLSLIKSHNRPDSTKDKIAALEAKLKQMEPKAESSSSEPSLLDPLGLRAHPSLPLKPSR